MSLSELNLHKLLAKSHNDNISNRQPLQKKLPFECRKIQTSDVYEQACSITAWQQLYDQLTPGAFQGCLFEVWLEGLQLFEETASQALHRSCIVWPGSVWFGIPKNNNNSFIHFFKIESHNIPSHAGGVEFELITPNNSQLIGLVVPENELAQYVHSAMNLPLGQDACVRAVDCEKKKKFKQLIQQTMTTIKQDEQAIYLDEKRENIKNTLLVALADLLCDNKDQTKVKNTQKAYQRTVSKAREYIVTHRSKSTSVTELCDYLHTSRRTLQNSFQRILNISPVHYIKAIRLNAVHRELLSHHSAYDTIQDAAASWGFNHMSQFAADYQQFFGELPSRTMSERGQIFQKIINR